MNLPSKAHLSSWWREPGRRAALGALVVILVLGAWLRLSGLDAAGLWFDEWITIDQSTRLSWGESMTASTTHPPLQRVVVRASIELFGDPARPGGLDWAARFPSALFGILGIAFIYLFARRFAGGHRGVGVLAAAFYAMGPYGIYYGQEARYYAAMVLFGAWALHALLLLLEAPRRPAHHLYLFVPLLLGIYNHHLFGILFLLTFLCAVPTLLRDLKRHYVLVLPWVAAGLLFLPWFVFSMSHLEGQARPWIPNLNAQSKDVLVGVFTGRIGAFHLLGAARHGASYYEPLVRAAALLLAAGFAVHLLRRRAGPARISAVVVTLSLLVTGLLHDRVMTMRFFHMKYLSFIYPFACLALAELACGLHDLARTSDVWRLPRLGLGRLWHRDWAAFTLFVILTALTVWTAAPLLSVTREAMARMRPGATSFFHREPYREAAAWVTRHRPPGSLVVIRDPYGRNNNVNTLRYYGVKEPTLRLTDKMLADERRLLSEHHLALGSVRSVVAVAAHCDDTSRKSTMAFVERRFPHRIRTVSFAGAEGWIHVAIYAKNRN